MTESAIWYWKIRVTGHSGRGHEDFVQDIIVPATSENEAMVIAETSFSFHFSTVLVTPYSSNSLGPAERSSQDPTGTNARGIPYWIVETKVPKELYCSRVEPIKGMPYIFVTESELEQGDIEPLCDKYSEKHRSIVIPGEALLVDLGGKEPRFKSVPRDYDRLNA